MCTCTEWQNVKHGFSISSHILCKFAGYKCIHLLSWINTETATRHTVDPTNAFWLLVANCHPQLHWSHIKHMCCAYAYQLICNTLQFPAVDLIHSWFNYIWHTQIERKAAANTIKASTVCTHVITLVNECQQKVQTSPRPILEASDVWVCQIDS